MTSRCRTSNFSLKERCVFIELLVTNYPFLHEDKGHSKVSNEMRTTAWNDLTDDFHVILADKNVYRTTKQLKTLYENIKHKIKRNISQGVMQALQTDVKTAKDIPLSLFMDLKSQYEGELGKSGDTGYLNPSFATGKGEGCGAAVGSNGCSHGTASGRQSCKYRKYSSNGSTKHDKKRNGSGSSDHSNSGHKVEKWMNSKNEEIIILDNKTIILNGCRNSKYPETSQVISNLPPNIGVRYPKNLSKNIYAISDSSDDDEEEENVKEKENQAEEELEEDELETGGEDSNPETEQVGQEISNHGNGHVNNSGERYSIGNYSNGNAYEPGNHSEMSSFGKYEVNNDEERNDNSNGHASNGYDKEYHSQTNNSNQYKSKENYLVNAEGLKEEFDDELGESANEFEAAGSPIDEINDSNGEFRNGDEDYESDH